jgi:hypothetical protein
LDKLVRRNNNTIPIFLLFHRVSTWHSNKNTTVVKEGFWHSCCLWLFWIAHDLQLFYSHFEFKALFIDSKSWETVNLFLLWIIKVKQVVIFPPLKQTTTINIQGQYYSSWSLNCLKFCFKNKCSSESWWSYENTSTNPCISAFLYFLNFIKKFYQEKKVVASIIVGLRLIESCLQAQ